MRKKKDKKRGKRDILEEISVADESIVVHIVDFESDCSIASET
jgi:hypothetical protein